MEQYDMLGRPLDPKTGIAKMNQNDHKTYYEAFDFNKVNFVKPSAAWSEEGHQTNKGYHQPCITLEQKITNPDGSTKNLICDFIDKKGYDNFRTQFPNQHRTLDDFGNRNSNKLDLGLFSKK